MTNAPMTKQCFNDWQAMVDGGMDVKVAFERMTDWAALLEDRLAELDANYMAHPWGQNKESIMPGAWVWDVNKSEFVPRDARAEQGMKR